MAWEDKKIAQCESFALFNFNQGSFIKLKANA
jgi:hypothetical protein